MIYESNIIHLYRILLNYSSFEQISLTCEVISLNKEVVFYYYLF